MKKILLITSFMLLGNNFTSARMLTDTNCLNNCVGSNYTACMNACPDDANTATCWKNCQNRIATCQKNCPKVQYPDVASAITIKDTYTGITWSCKDNTSATSCVNELNQGNFYCHSGSGCTQTK